jgi:hypothetical protein
MKVHHVTDAWPITNKTTGKIIVAVKMSSHIGRQVILVLTAEVWFSEET